MLLKCGLLKCGLPKWGLLKCAENGDSVMPASARPLAMSLLFTALPDCAPAMDFQVSTPDAVQGRFAPAQYYNGYGCTGRNIAPRIVWQGAPAQARSFAVTIFDPDAQNNNMAGHGWWHWLIVDIPASSHELTPGQLPLGAFETVTDYGNPGYGGPCPPQGQDHRYIITVSALKVAKLTLPADRSPATVEAAIKAQAIKQAQTTLMAAR